MTWKPWCGPGVPENHEPGRVYRVRIWGGEEREARWGGWHDDAGQPIYDVIAYQQELQPDRMTVTFSCTQREDGTFACKESVKPTTLADLDQAAEQLGRDIGKHAFGPCPMQRALEKQPGYPELFQSEEEEK